MREVSECDGSVSDLDVTGAPSMFNLIRSVTVLARRFPQIS
jgi:hypothetical protein